MRNAPADFYAKAAATEPIKIMAHVEEVHPVSANDPSLVDFGYPDFLVTWQHSAPESEKLRWINSGCVLTAGAIGNPRCFFPAT